MSLLQPMLVLTRKTGSRADSTRTVYVAVEHVVALDPLVTPHVGCQMTLVSGHVWTMVETAAVIQGMVDSGGS